MTRFKEHWRKLVSGLYVPPLLRLGHWYHGTGRCCCCVNGNCVYCSGTGDNAPCRISATLMGITNDTCLSCDNYNTTYTLLKEPSCLWRRLTLSSPGCNYARITLVLTTNPAPYSFRLWLHHPIDPFGPSYIEWRKTYANKPDCLKLSNEVLSLASESPSGPDKCDGSASSASLTSL